MDRLTPEQLVFRFDIWRKLHSHWLPDQADRQLVELRDQLQSLSQEAVREEVLEEATKACERHLYGTDEFQHGVRTCIEAIVALKREPNAAAQAGQGPSAAPSHEGHAAGPAPAAPDVASMVKRLRACCIDYDGSEEVDGAPPVIVPSCAELRQAASLLERLSK